CEFADAFDRPLISANEANFPLIFFNRRARREAAEDAEKSLFYNFVVIFRCASPQEKITTG
ncbi:MAG: hypothetical protein PHX39_09570, partial [Bacteroidales bacterium]|nr:hypothetical protein [Bacteroidales bacterium]